MRRGDCEIFKTCSRQAGPPVYTLRSRQAVKFFYLGNMDLIPIIHINPITLQNKMLNMHLGMCKKHVAVGIKKNPNIPHNQRGGGSTFHNDTQFH